MPFATDHDAIQRLQHHEPLTIEEIKDMLPHTYGLGVFRETLSAHLALTTMLAVSENKKAIENFDRSSTTLATRILWLTWALVGLTVAMLFFMALPWIVKG